MRGKEGKDCDNFISRSEGRHKESQQCRRNFTQNYAYKDLPRHNADVEHRMVAVGEISEDKEVLVLVRQALSLSSTLKISEIYIIAHVLLPNTFMYIKRFKESLYIMMTIRTWNVLPSLWLII